MPHKNYKSGGTNRVCKVGEFWQLIPKISSDQVDPNRCTYPSCEKTRTNLHKSRQNHPSSTWSSIPVHGVLRSCMESNGSDLEDVEHLLSINRVFAALVLNEDVQCWNKFSVSQ